MILKTHISTTRTPTILIYSDIVEGEVPQSLLSRLLHEEILSQVKIIQCNSVAKGIMKKCLKTICNKEKIVRLRDADLEEIITSSAGDMRNAVMNLQFQMSNRRNGGHYERDVRLSPFHALGKLLYAKRITHPSDKSGRRISKCGDQRPPLSFNPENVMEMSDMGQESSLTFLAYHSPDFFTDEGELSTTYDLFSDAACFLGRAYDSQRDRTDTTFPLKYASSLISRAVACNNRHPAPKKFRPLGAPKIFDVFKKSRTNEIKLLELFERLSVEGHIPMNNNIGSSTVVVTQYLPFLRIILPNVVNDALQNLHSFARPNEKSMNTRASEEILKAKDKEQEEVLAVDDIVDDDDSADSIQKRIFCGNKGTSKTVPCNEIPLKIDCHDRYREEFIIKESEIPPFTSGDSRPNHDIIIIDI